jgi:hypothetical protein
MSLLLPRLLLSLALLHDSLLLPHRFGSLCAAPCLVTKLDELLEDLVLAVVSLAAVVLQALEDGRPPARPSRTRQMTEDA